MLKSNLQEPKKNYNNGRVKVSHLYIRMKRISLGLTSLFHDLCHFPYDRCDGMSGVNGTRKFRVDAHNQKMWVGRKIFRCDTQEFP